MAIWWKGGEQDTIIVCDVCHEAIGHEAAGVWWIARDKENQAGPWFCHGSSYRSGPPGTPGRECHTKMWQSLRNREDRACVCDMDLAEWLAVLLVNHGPETQQQEEISKEARPAKFEVTVCYLCHQDLAEPIEQDHVLPISKGGYYGVTMPVHKDCNRKKKNKPWW